MWVAVDLRTTCGCSRTDWSSLRCVCSLVSILRGRWWRPASLFAGVSGFRYRWSIPPRSATPAAET